MASIVVGRAGKSEIRLDLETLLYSRLLIQANSGGGKSWLLRRLAEQVFGKVPVIILDPEGEFATLREKFGFVLVGKGGETSADPRSAAVVAHKLLELRASAVCDIYDLKPGARHLWVRLFLEALIEAPKEYRHPTLVILDEAHVFCPEKGQGESEASDAAVDLASRGRKRGLCAVFATQRLSKLRKSASAELLNRLVGGTYEDLDLERAADVLSIPKAERQDFFRMMKVLDAGNFWALGRAIAKERVLFQVGDVETTHPEPGVSISTTPPPAPDKVRAMMPKLADLPKLAEEKAKTEKELRDEVRSLKAQLAARPKEVVAKVEEKKVDRPVLKGPELSRLEKSIAKIEATVQRLTTLPLGAFAEDLRAMLGPVKAELQRASRPATVVNIATRWPTPATRPDIAASRSTPPPARFLAPPETLNAPRPDVSREDSIERYGVHVKAGARRMLQVLAQRNGIETTKAQLGTLSNFAVGGGTFGTYWSSLVRAGLAYEVGDRCAITDAGINFLDGDIPALPESPELLRASWKLRLKAGAAKMLDVLAASGPLTKADLGERSGFEVSGGTFGTYLGILKRNGLAREVDGTVAISEELVG